MSMRYTIFNEQSINDFNLISDSESAVDFLCNKKNFRPFNQGLTELLQKVNFQGDLSSVQEKSDFLMKKLGEINSTITDKTVWAWLSGEYRPKIEPHSRPQMYEICFALNLNLEQVQWFFNHVYFDRTFNCHIISEVVYYYAFLKNLNYFEANKIISDIESAPIENTSDSDSVYTQLLKKRITLLETVDELKEFLIQNKKNFTTWNTAALEQIKKLFTEIVGDEVISKPIIQKLKRIVKKNLDEIIIDDETDRNLDKTFFFNESEINRCGLLIRYICFNGRAEKNIGGKYIAGEIFDAISKNNVFSHTFVLNNFLGMITGIKKNLDLDIPYILKNNFPSKKILSDVLDEKKVATSKSYDAIRKTLILFHFYNFWYKIKIGDIQNLDSEEIEHLPEIYREEIDILLENCGYESLFAGNPYDWIFLCSANSKDPNDSKNYSYAIDFFSELIFTLTDL